MSADGQLPLDRMSAMNAVSLSLPPYTRMEYERRFLVDPASDWKRWTKPYSRRIEDRYLSCGRLRVRAMTNLDTPRVIYKLTKKFESPMPDRQPVVNIYLSEPEWRELRQLPGNDLVKVRYYHEYEGRVFSVDEFTGKLQGMVLCETEADSAEELAAIQFPHYATKEVTGELRFTGGDLARRS